MVELQACGADVTFNLRVRPGARKNAILGVHDGKLKVGVAAAPERGKANAAIVELLASTLNIPKSAIAIVHGLTSSDKRVRIAGIARTELQSRIAALLANDSR